jgi:hypothetical protein
VLGGETTSGCRECLAGAIDRPAADARTGWTARACSTHKDDRAAVRNRWRRRCSRPGGFPSAASASSTAIRISAIIRCSRRARAGAGINLLDYGCIRVFPPKFVGGVVDLYNGLRRGDDSLVVHAYETWGFRKLSRE